LSKCSAERRKADLPFVALTENINLVVRTSKLAQACLDLSQVMLREKYVNYSAVNINVNKRPVVNAAIIKVALITALIVTGLVSADEIVVVAGAAGTSQTGSWNTASAASMPLNGNYGRYATSGSVATYTFTPNLPESTTYTVEVYNTCYSPRGHNVRHAVTYAGGNNTQLVEQDCALDPYVGAWRPLGSFPFEAGTGGSVTISAAGANNSYVGATAVRFVYTPSAPGNTAPVLHTSHSAVTVNEGDFVELTATASDHEDGDLTDSIIWSGNGIYGSGAAFTVQAGTDSFNISASVTDSENVTVPVIVPVTVLPAQLPPEPGISQLFEFECTGDTPLAPLTGFTTNNASALPTLGKRCGKYMADVLTNANNVTLHFNDRQGRFDGVQVSFPFTAIARGVGIAPLQQPDSPLVVPGAYLFSGVQVHHANLNNLNSAHVVVGQRGSKANTIEGKHTRNGSSSQDDIGANALPDGRADIRIVGNADQTLTVYWQPHQPDAEDNWILYEAPGSGRTPGVLRGDAPEWGSSTVYVGLITYAFEQLGVPFSGVIESFEVIQQ
jgi:hypothetical protein